MALYILVLRLHMLEGGKLEKDVKPRNAQFNMSFNAQFQYNQ